MTADTRKTIGFFAESFGFGPASKAASIARRCVETINVDALFFADSIAHEYFVREAIGLVTETGMPEYVCRDDLNRMCETLDAAVVVLQPEWACALQGRVPVAYVDSLGFMWAAGFFDRYPKLKEVDAYLAQDLFGAAKGLGALGVRNLIATAPIVARRRVRSGPSKGRIVHLGGLLNIFSQSDGIDYANFALDLVDGFVDQALTSSSAAARLLKSDLPMLCLDNSSTLARFAASEMVFTSPGLTALLELGQLRANVLPLPPQNYSQALIVSFISTALPTNPVWRFMNEQYPVQRELPEREGVEMVRALNRQNAASHSFRSRYRHLIETTNTSSLPEQLTATKDGVAQCVAAIEALLGREQHIP